MTTAVHNVLKMIEYLQRNSPGRNWSVIVQAKSHKSLFGKKYYIATALHRYHRISSTGKVIERDRNASAEIKLTPEELTMLGLSSPCVFCITETFHF